jgi:hypothetical protein
MTDHTLQSRRQWLRGSATAIGAAALAPTALVSDAGAQPPNRKALIGGLINQLGQQATWRSSELRLARRITLGLNEVEVARVQALGYDAYLEEQLNPSRIDDSAMDARVQAVYGRLLGFTPRQLLDFDELAAGTALRVLVRPRARADLEFPRTDAHSPGTARPPARAVHRGRADSGQHAQHLHAALSRPGVEHTLRPQRELRP